MNGFAKKIRVFRTFILGKIGKNKVFGDIPEREKVFCRL